MGFEIFTMERWQSTWEHEVDFNLSESGVEPVALGELLELADVGADELLSTALEYNYSRGTPELRERIAPLYPGATADDILVTNGGSEANYVLAWSLLEPGDELVYTCPNYMQVTGLASNFGARPIEWPLREDLGWNPDPADLDQLVGDRTRVILVTNPNNPTGSIMPEETIEAVVEAAERVGAWILADEIYRGAELAGDESPTFWGRTERLAITSGLSKAYGLPGLRIGWLVGPGRDRIEELWAHKDYTTISMGVLSDRLARLALAEPVRTRLLERTRSILRTNWPTMEDWLSERADAFRWTRPEAGAIVWVRYDLPVDSLELAERLRVQSGCLIVPGEHFGMDDYLRLGFGPEQATLRTALERCAPVFDALRDERTS